MADVRICTWCGGPIPPNGSCSCDRAGRARREGSRDAPDPWELADHPERYDTEAARRRSRTYRR